MDDTRSYRDTVHRYVGRAVRLLLPVELPYVYEHFQKYLPDSWRNPGPFTLLFSRRDCLFFRLGEAPLPSGCLFLTDIVPGWKATLHVSIWEKDMRGLGKKGVVYDFLTWLIDFVGVIRIEALVPTDNIIAHRYAERAGLHREGVLRKGGAFDGVLKDLVIYGRLKED